MCLKINHSFLISDISFMLLKPYPILLK